MGDPPFSDQSASDPDAGIARRGFLRNILMLGSLAAAYGGLGFAALRFLAPGRRRASRSRMFVASTVDVTPGQSISFATPEGENFLLTNTGESMRPFIAFSSRCPHLGCKVHWEGDKQRFYCPCHGGAFDSKGAATAGPPAQSGQALKACELEVEGEAIYALVERA